MSWWSELKQAAGNPLRRILPAAKVEHPEPGLYHFSREDQAGKTRLHLRVDPDGHGTLLINANGIIHLNPTACLMAYYHLQGLPDARAVRLLQARFQVSLEQARDDYRAITADLEAFAAADGQPIHPQSEVTFHTPFSQQPAAPYRMDLAVTYRCNNECPHCYNARARSYPELPTEDWLRIIDRLWELEIPHVVFTGGEPTLRDDLPELIRYAESKGQITGLNTNGRRISDPDYLDSLVQAGLDHIQITLESHRAEVHDHMVACRGAWEQTVRGIRSAVRSPLYVMTNTTMLEGNYREIGRTLDFLAELGVPTVGLNALIYSGKGKQVGTGLGEDQLEPLLEIAQEKTDRAEQRLIWYTPTTYCQFNPLEHDLGVKGCTAALYNMCVEPDGGVIPCQSYYQQLGDLLRDPWESIWHHPLAVQLRERRGLPEECAHCGLLFECGGGCPLSRQEQPIQVTADSPIP